MSGHFGREADMNNGATKKLRFSEYMRHTKEELLSRLTDYPELLALSVRELEVFSQLLTDKTQEQIAAELFVSSSSVHFHCKNIYKKLGVTGRRQILIKYKDM